jgi:hypothetical protein
VRITSSTESSGTLPTNRRLSLIVSTLFVMRDGNLGGVRSGGEN